MIGNFSSFTLQSVSAILSAELNALKNTLKMDLHYKAMPNLRLTVQVCMPFWLTGSVKDLCSTFLFAVMEILIPLGILHFRERLS